MQKSKMALASLMLAVTAMLAVGCTKPDEPGNGGNGGNIGSGTYNGHKFVDLGLPSGTLWATCNVGANTPEGYGDYFAWGETQTKSTYNWDTYKYASGHWNKLTKYCNRSAYGYNCFIDNLTVLQPSDDAATANWGSGWCMPTRAQCQELYQNTTLTTWTTQNGVYGWLFTASNGNSLFLPAAGYRYNGNLYYAGSYVFSWSSSLYVGDPGYAWSLLRCDSSYSMSESDYRDYGHSVRPVRSSGQK